MWQRTSHKLSLVVFLFYSTTFRITAWPSNFNCDYACLSDLTPGAAFGNMGVANFEPAPTGSNCSITTAIPAGGFVPGQSYVVTVSSDIALGRKLACDRPVFDGQSIVNERNKFTITNHTWIAPGDASVTFRALCGAGGNTDKVWIASQLSVNKAAGLTLGPTTPQTTTRAGGVTTGSVELMPGITLASTMVQDKVQFVVTSNRNSWIAVGFSRGNTVSMTGDGQGVDVFACADGAVKRYWVTSYLTPSGGAEVPDAVCEYVSGSTSMTFSRTLNGRRLNSVAITPGTAQLVTYARGTDGTTGLAYHESDRGGKLIDFQSLTVSEAAKKPVENALYMHLIFMVLAFGILFPWGVILADRIRKMSGGSDGAWFRLHQKFQYTGWFFQLAGGGMAYWHCADNVGEHFRNGHTYVGAFVIGLATLQPFIALLRKLVKHPDDEELKTRARLLWEGVHKTVGYFAIFLGIANAFYGVYLLIDQNYETQAIAIAFGLIGVGLIPVDGYFLLTLVKQNNCCSRMCARSVSNSKC